jgi:hypothetical protein
LDGRTARINALHKSGNIATGGDSPPESVLVFSGKHNYVGRGHLLAAMIRILTRNQARPEACL